MCLALALALNLFLQAGIYLFPFMPFHSKKGGSMDLFGRPKINEKKLFHLRFPPNIVALISKMFIIV